MFNNLQSYILFVEDLESVSDWYQNLFNTLPYRKDDTFVGFKINNCQFGIHKADNKITHGNSTVGYWNVNNIQETIKKFTLKGAEIYRLPIEIEENQIICQIKDPFSNIIGLIETK